MQVLVVDGVGVTFTVVVAVGEGGRIGWIDASVLSMSMSMAASSDCSCCCCCCCWCEFLKIHLRSCAISIIGAAAWAAALGMQILDSSFVAFMHDISGLESAEFRTGWPRARARCTARARSPVGMSCMMADGAGSRPGWRRCLGYLTNIGRVEVVSRGS